MQNSPFTPTQDQGCGRKLAWTFAGFVLPFYSLEYYIGVIRRPLRSALWFFAAFMTLATVLTTASINQVVDVFRQQVDQAYQAGTIPTITIKDGVAEADGTDPFMLQDGDRYFLAVDTAGAMNRETFTKFDYGFLLTKTQLYRYIGHNYQAVDLQSYNSLLNLNPIVIDGKGLEQAFGPVASFYLGLLGVMIWFYYLFIWMFFLAITAYFIFGPVQQLLPQFSFGTVLTVGIYAHLPAYVINHILNLFGVRLVFQYTMLLFVFWVGALYLVLHQVAGELLSDRDDVPRITKPIHIDAQPPKLWPAWLGLPIIVFMSADAVFNWDFAPIYVLAGLVVTIGALLFVDSRQHAEDERKVEDKQ